MPLIFWIKKMKYPGLGLTILAYGYTMERFFNEQKANWKMN